MSMPKSRLMRIVLPVLGLSFMAAAGWEMGMPRQPSGTTEATVALRGPIRHGGIALETLRGVQKVLNSALVENTHGDPVGTVQKIVVNKAGRPQLVRVAFGGFLGIGESVVPLKADTLGYDPRGNKVLTDMTRKELEVIAARRSRGS